MVSKVRRSDWAAFLEMKVELLLSETHLQPGKRSQIKVKEEEQTINDMEKTEKERDKVTLLAKHGKEKTIMKVQANKCIR